MVAGGVIAGAVVLGVAQRASGPAAFLLERTGWDVSSAPLGQTAAAPLWWTILNAVLNTLLASMVTIVVTTLAGFLTGLGRVSANPVVAALCRLYTDLFRNVPSLLQVVFWYQVLSHLPVERRAWSGFGAVFLSNRGLYLPAPAWASGVQLLYPALAAGGMGGLAWWASRGRPYAVRCGAVFGSGLAGAAAVGAAVGIGVDLPVLKGFSFQGGFRLPTEFLALVIGLSVFYTAYIAEVVRGGLLSVERGLLEAGRSLGLREMQVHRLVRLPLALRTIVLPLGSQYLNIVKTTSLGAAIGFAELFGVTSNGINMSGHTFELLAVMVGLYFSINIVLASGVRVINARAALVGLHRPASATDP